MAVIHKLKLATLDISKAYLQAGDLQKRHIHETTDWLGIVRGEVWK